jgi:hypothetical protein
MVLRCVLYVPVDLVSIFRRGAQYCYRLPPLYCTTDTVRMSEDVRTLTKIGLARFKLLLVPVSVPCYRLRYLYLVQVL